MGAPQASVYLEPCEFGFNILDVCHVDHKSLFLYEKLNLAETVVSCFKGIIDASRGCTVECSLSVVCRRCTILLEWRQCVLGRELCRKFRTCFAENFQSDTLSGRHAEHCPRMFM